MSNSPHSMVPNAEPIPGYRLLERLGRGGYGEVWKCEAPGGIQKAIKFVFGDMEGFGNAGEAAEQEYRSLNRVKTIRHPYILSLERFDIINGQLLIVMELADRNLWDRFNECVLSGLPGIPHDELYGYLEEAAEALDLMNGHYQIQHMDIKPQNLFLVHNHIKVADFGLAKDLEGARAAMTGGVTPTYAPPETFEGWVSRHSDQYSLAIVYQEMLTGRRPFNGTNTRQLIMQHMTAAPDLSTLNLNNQAAVGRALSKVPTDRFPTCSEFVKALKGTDANPPFAEVLPGRLREMMTPRSTSKGIAPQAVTPRLRNPDTTSGEAGSNRKMPALVTPGSKEKPPLVTPQSARRQLTTPDSRTSTPTGNAIKEQRGDGCLFPALFIGLGGTGLKTLAALRAQMTLKFGRNSLPNVRWLAIDTDPSNVEEFVDANAWPTDEIILARLQRPAHYLQHEALPSVDTWLPQGMLYSMPRSLLTEGNRAFGRLAFCDHYRIIRQRIRAILESLSKAESVALADKITQLGLRGNIPRAYVIGSLAGGTASGMAIDLAYVIRKEMRLLGLVSGQVIGMFSMPTQRKTEGFYNSRATIREISYFDWPGHNYHSSFDSREEALTDSERPFRRCELVPVSPKGDKDREVIAERLANMVVAESFTPAGRTVHPDDVAAPTSSFCIPALTRVIWPHQIVTEFTVSRLNRMILTEWAGPVNWGLRDYLRPLLDNIWGERNLQSDQLGQVFELAAQKEFGCGVLEMLAVWLQPFRLSDRRSQRDSEDLLNVVFHIIDLLGRMGSEGDDQNPGKLAKFFRSMEKTWISESDSGLITSIVSLIEQPGLRLPAADLFIRFLEEKIGLEIEAADRKIGQLELELTDEYTQLFSLSSTSIAGRASKLAKRLSSSENSFREVMNILKKRIDLLVHRQVFAFYKGLAKNLPDYVREVEQCRNQLIVYAGQITDPKLPEFKDIELTRFYFGERATNPTQVADELIGLLSQEARRDLEQTLQAKIRHEGRGLVKMCVKHQEFGQVFMQLLREQTRRFLEPIIFEYASKNATWDSNGQKLISKMLTDTYQQFSAVSNSLRPSITVAGLPAEGRHLRLVQFAKETTSGIPFVPLEVREEMWVYRECRGIDPLRILDETPDKENSDHLNDDDLMSATKHARCDVVWPTS